MAQHTPGPWKHEHRRSGGDVVVRQGEAPGAPIAEVWHNGHDPVANARLIAAAPELLASCKALREELRLIRMKDCGAVYDPTCRVLADAAIAKATEASSPTSSES